MTKEMKIIYLKKQIEEKRQKLNTIVLKEMDKEEILKFSQELDILIVQYTSYIAKMNEK